MHLRCLLFAGLLSLLCLPLRADDDGPRKWHPWGRLAPGAWKRVRVLKESFDAAGNPAGVSEEETRTTLMQVDELGYRLHLDATIDAAGRRITAEQTVQLGFWGESKDQTATVKLLEDDVSIAIDGAQHACQQFEVQIAGESLKRRTLLHTSKANHFPLRQETKAYLPSDNALLYETSSTVLSDQWVHRVAGRNCSVYLLRTVHRRTNEGVTITHELHCPEVPGGVVAQWTKAHSVDGRLRERSHLELLDFQSSP